MYTENGNNSFIWWTIKDTIPPPEGEECEHWKASVDIDKWLIENGAEDAPNENDCGEEVLLLISW